MNELSQAIVLGALQGFTEFLPVSSSGHLVLAQQALGERFRFANEALLFDLVLHCGTLIPVLWFYRLDLIAMLRALLLFKSNDQESASHRRLFGHVVLGTLPTAMIGLLFKDVFESLFQSVTAVCISLAVTGALLWSTKRSQKSETPQVELNARTALLVGLVQGLAITPGISRSGSTIAVALLLGIERGAAARFSFLLSIPAICGGVILQAKDGVPLDNASLSTLLAGFTTSMAIGYMALLMLVALVQRGRLYRFAYYLWPLSLLAFLTLGIGVR